LLIGPRFLVPVLPGWMLSATGGAIAVGCLTFGWTGTGRTVGKQLAGLLWILVSRRNASAQDLVVGSVVSYAWRYRPPQ
jgi:hypothetical protein